MRSDEKRDEQMKPEDKSPPLDEDVPGFPAEVLGYAYTLSYEFLVAELDFSIF